MVDVPVEFIEGYGRPCGLAVTSGLVEGASDSVHRQSQWTFQFLRDGYAFSVGMAAMREWPFFALLQLSGVERQFFGALDGEEFFAIEGSCAINFSDEWIYTC